MQISQRSEIVKLLGVGALSLGINYLIYKKLLQINQRQHTEAEQKSSIITQVIKQQKSEYIEISQKKPSSCVKKQQNWGTLKLINANESKDPLILELKMMDSLLFEVSRVNNLIVDLQLTEFIPILNPLVSTSIKREKNEPYLSRQTLTSPGEFILKQCRFTPGNFLELQKKYMRAGPRASNFIHPNQVKADIVCLGGVCPGINTVIRQITIMLKSASSLCTVTGVKNSLKGYYNNDFVNLSQKIVETIHHHGGCFLGLGKTDFHVDKIVDNLVQREVNQLYIVGANKAMNVCQQIHNQIKKRKLSIAVCVLLKGINRDIPIFDTCFGFETAVEESSKMIEKAYNYCHSQQNGISLVKLHGYNSGFLACYAVLSTVNANICLVPEFQFDMHGPKGLFSAILWRIKNKGSCTIVYSDGAEKALRDCCILKQGSCDTTTEFDNFLYNEIQRKMKEEGIQNFSIGMFNGIEISRTSPANAIDTKLCCQIAQASIMGMMAGYTNFAIGHLANKSTMISVDELIQEQTKTQLKYHDDIWQQTVMATGQPRLLNDEYVIKTP